MTVEWTAILILFFVAAFAVIRIFGLSGQVDRLSEQMNLHKETWESQFKYNELIDKSIGRVEDRTR